MVSKAETAKRMNSTSSLSGYQRRLTRQRSFVAKPLLIAVDDTLWRGKNRIVVTSNPVGGKVTGCADDTHGSSPESLFNNPGAGGAPHHGLT